MKNRNFSINIIFTLLFLIISALFLIYIFRDINCREYFNAEGESYSWNFGNGNIVCTSNLKNTNSELMNVDSDFIKDRYNRYENTDLFNKTRFQNIGNNVYKGYCDVMTNNDLLAYRCLKISPLQLKGFLDTNNIEYTYETIYIYNEVSLFEYLYSKISSKKIDVNTKIIGPVYVCISQSPYLKYLNKNNQNNTIDKTLDARIDILNNRNPFYLENINEIGEQNFIINTSDITSRDGSIISSLYCQILILYPLYNKGSGMRLKTTVKTEQKNIIANFLDTVMANHYTDNNLCYIKCNKSSQLNCGCLSYDSNSAETLENTYFNKITVEKQEKEIDLPKYTARCIDHTTNPVNKNGNFSMMYFVNPYANNYTNTIEDPDTN